MRNINRNFLMPWGKHAGEKFKDIPLGYLGWIVENSDACTNIKNAARDEIRARLGVEATPSIKEIYRQLAMRYHPDHGGSDEAFRAIHEFKERLSR